MHDLHSLTTCAHACMVLWSPFTHGIIVLSGIPFPRALKLAELSACRAILDILIYGILN